jgi:hypothetical protein
LPVLSSKIKYFNYIYSDIGEALKLVKIFFPFLKFFEKPLKTPYEYIKIAINSIGSIWAYFIIIMLLFPSLGASYHVDVGHIRLLSDRKIQNDHIQDIRLKEVDNTLKKNKLYDNSIKIYAREFQSYMWYKMLNPFDLIAYPSYAVTFENRVFLTPVDFKNNSIRRFREDPFPASATGILLHESVHTLQHQKYGWFKMRFTIPTWVTEGYAEYSAMPYMNRDTIDNLKTILRKDGKSWNGREEYIVWGFMVKHAIEKMHKSVDELHLGKVSYDEVFTSLMDEYHITKVTK